MLKKKFDIRNKKIFNYLTGEEINMEGGRKKKKKIKCQCKIVLGVGIMARNTNLIHNREPRAAGRRWPIWPAITTYCVGRISSMKVV